MENTDKRLFLLDAFALIFRAYYALINSPRITTKGRNTNAQFGFTNALVDLINNQKPSHMAVCFDTSAPTERHTDFADYKANRQEAPEDLTSAIPDIKAIVKGFNIPIMELDGYEADDVIGTLSKQAAAAGYEVYMVTPDKDYGQLVSEKIKIYKPPYQGGLAEILGPKEVCEKWNIKDVSQVIDILGLMGDAVDNIPGIKGVGEKTAAKLLSEFGTLENVIAGADNIKGALGDHAFKVAVSSTKSMTGHLLGAAGVLEAIFSILAIRDNVAPPTINYGTPDPACDLDFVPNTARQMPIDVALSNSFGFGGTNGTLIFRRFSG